VNDPISELQKPNLLSIIYSPYNISSGFTNSNVYIPTYYHIRPNVKIMSTDVVNLTVNLVGQKRNVVKLKFAIANVPFVYSDDLRIGALYRYLNKYIYR